MINIKWHEFAVKKRHSHTSPPIGFLGPIGTSVLFYLLLSIKNTAWPTKTLKPPQPKPTIGYNFVNRAYGHPGGAGYRRG